MAIKLGKKNIIIIVVAVVFLAIVGVFYGMKFQGEKSAKLVASQTIDYINKNLVRSGTTVSFVDISDDSGIYKLVLQLATAEAATNSEVHVTKDGRLLFIPYLDVIDMKPGTVATTTTTETGSQTQNNTDDSVNTTTCETMAKAEKPLVEAFVVSNCPYGLQMQRIIYEIVKSIPSFAANMKVEYMGAIQDNKITSMHGDAEAQENLRQICIREEQSAKYWDYVGCYIKEGKSTDCLATAKIDTTKLNTCTTDANKGLKYAAVDFAAEAKYKVTGSPTLLVNGQNYNKPKFPIEYVFGGRTAEAVKSLICCGSQQKSDACSKILATSSAATSFSKTYTTSGASNNSSSCQ
jgi:hypothetical protein